MENKNGKMMAWVLVALVLGGLIGYWAAASMKPSGVSDKQAAFATTMRKLWADHVFWTRDYIIAGAAGSPDANAAATRLLKNQEDIGNAIAPYYGADAGAKLTGLLKQHILIAVDLLGAAKKGDAAKLKDANARWSANADEMATFLSGANPNWPKQAVLDMLNTHLALTENEAVDRLQGKWDDDATNFDHIFDEAMMMADTFSSGIVKQFPDKF